MTHKLAKARQVCSEGFTSHGRIVERDQGGVGGVQKDAELAPVDSEKLAGRVRLARHSHALGSVLANHDFVPYLIDRRLERNLEIDKLVGAAEITHEE
jgi:hypothetical protein